jgi:predicted TIM-barrel fold metal-dependent hydrolase
MVVAPAHARRTEGFARRGEGGQNSAYGSLRYFMPRLLVVLGVLLAVPFVSADLPAQGRGRPGQGREPEFPAPTIRDYKPRSTLIVPQHPVPRAKFPVVDIHGHPPALTSPAIVDRIVAEMDALNLRVMVNAGGTSAERLRESLQTIRASRHSDRIVMFTNLNFRDVSAGFGRRAAQQVEEDVKAGALGVGEIMKDFGLRARKPDGTRLKLDDPELDPIWETCARLNIPVFIHAGEPSEFFQPIDNNNERWLELALFPDRRYQDRSRYPAFEELMAERDRLLSKHPDTTFILAHLGWHANDLGRLGAMMDRLPNVYGEIGAVLYDLGRQPRTAQAFFAKYQDRILFGKDSYQPDEYPYYWRTLETADDYFDYYRDYHAFWKLYGLALPDAVLRKLYYENALKLIPGLPRAGFPAS